MERTDYLDLYKLANGDYANRWEIPMNANAQAIDDELANLATELLDTVPTAAPHYSGQLARTAGSLEQRLDAAMDDNGNIIYNNGDLDKSCHQMDGFETTEISARLANIDRREFVNARLRYLQQTVTSGEYLNKIDAYDPTVALSQVETSRNADSFVQRYGSQLFCFGTDCTDPSHAGGGVINIDGMGWCSIGGRLFYHKNTSYHTLAAAGQWKLFLTEEPYVGGGVVNIDNRLVRSYAATGHNGDTTIGSIFNSTGIGAASSIVANNDWQPEAFQILRIEPSVGVFHEYLIKAVNADSIEIYGEFPYGPPPVSGIHWWILDYTIPCVNLKPFVFGSVTDLQKLMTETYYYDNAFLITHMLSYDNIAATFYASRVGGAASLIYMNPKQIFVNMSSVALGVNEYFEAQFDGAGTLNISPYNVKNMSVLCMDKWSNNVNSTVFVFSVDPRLLTGASCLPIVHPEIVRTMTMDGIAEIQNTWFDAPLAPGGGGPISVRTYLRVHCDTAKESTAWTNDPLAGAGVFKGRQWWGVLVEYN